MKKNNFDEWYNKAFKRMVSFVTYRVRNKQEAEDIVSDIMISMYHNFKRIEDADAYFFSAVKLALIKKDTRSKGKMVSLDSTHTITYNFINSQDPSCQMEVEEINTEWNRIINEMPSEEKQVYLTYKSGTITNLQLESHFEITHRKLYQIIGHVENKLLAAFPTFAYSKISRETLATQER